MKFFNDYKRIRSYISDPKHYPRETYDTISVLLYYLEFYVNTASIQMSRIFEDDKELKDAYHLTGPEGHGTMVVTTRYFADIHFCIVSLDKAYKLAKELAAYMKDDELQGIMEKYSHLDAYRKARNALEHMEENFTKSHWFLRDMSTVVNDTITLNRTEFKIHESTLQPIYAMYEEVIDRFEELYGPGRQ